MKLYEQVDRNGDGKQSIYSWMLEGIGWNARRQMTLNGWKWIRGIGCRGCYTTQDAATAALAASRLNLTIASNGTHKTLGAKMYFVFNTLDAAQREELQNIFGVEIAA